MSDRVQKDVFISHAWEDKEAVARPLALALKAKGLQVWFDEFELRVGDSLSQVIDHGLSSSRFGVVILSPKFFAKDWPRRELNGLLTREIADKTKVLLPIWYGLTYEDVVNFSPILADKVAVRWSQGLDNVVDQLLAAIKPNLNPPPLQDESHSSSGETVLEAA